MPSMETIGFIGLGVMGGPMCRNMALKHAGRVLAFDLSADALAALGDTKAEPVVRRWKKSAPRLLLLPRRG